MTDAQVRERVLVLRRLDATANSSATCSSGMAFAAPRAARSTNWRAPWSKAPGWRCSRKRPCSDVSLEALIAAH